MEVEQLLHILVADPGYTKRRGDLENIRRQPLVQAFESFILDRPVRHVPYACVHGWVHRRSLGLQSSAEHVEGIDRRRAESAG